MGILSGHGDQLEKVDKICTPTTADLIKRNREESRELRALNTAFEVIDGIGLWEMREIPHFRETFLAAYGLTQIRTQRLGEEFEKLYEMLAEEEADPPL